jgi:hypothetical protein
MPPHSFLHSWAYKKAALTKHDWLGMEQLTLVGYFLKVKK